MNSVVLIGRITKDLDLRYTTGENPKAIVKFNLAVDRVNGETDFPRIIVWGKQAENLDRYCGKGSRIGVQGRIQTDSYKDKDGNTVYTTDVIADRVEFLSWKSEEKSDTDIEVQEEFAQLDEDVPF